MRHDPGLDASPPVRYILEVERSGYSSFHLSSAVDGQTPREVGCSSLGTFSTRFTELVGVPPSVYRLQAARATAGMPSCVAKQVTRPIRTREVRVRGRE